MIYENVYNQKNLLKAWKKIRLKKSAPGIDRVSVYDFEKKLDQNLKNLADELRKGTYRPMPVMVYGRAKKGAEQRVIGLSTVRDKIVQKSVEQVLSPLFEQHFLDCSYAYRPHRSALGAVNRATQQIQSGKVWCLQADISSFFDTIDHTILMALIEPVVKEKPVQKLIVNLLKAKIFRQMGLFDNTTGATQGSGLSPLLSNIYLHPLDKLMWEQYHARYLRYSDDLTLFGSSKEEVDEAVPLIENCLAELKLRLHPQKTKLTHIADGVTYLGYHLDAGGKGPSTKAVNRLQEKLTAYHKVRKIAVFGSMLVR